MTEEKYCEKCNQKMIASQVDEGGLKGLLIKNPKGAQLFQNKKHTRLNPYVCPNCGLTEWYANEPDRLL
ncbi:hypothetical protein J416_08012 [Gracilibacillus halophilus YIM-C55.5]|uniref:Nucleic acid-binding protein n=1 Tax=Gracilibacillus halophilus YIM-C55.5 TaxID=1308866 RepID=N4WVA2_9BACI|nr:hypothetical protein [Gracilibacillus halophilus]ENH97006.1 hypothetical protein J416_08012 [Gracilibacillus halophilus YIM-C55.5]